MPAKTDVRWDINLARWAVGPPHRLVHLEMQRVCSVLKRAKQIRDIRVIHWFTRIVRNQILLRHISHVIALVVFGQKMVKRLLFDGSAFLWNSLVPIICVGKLRIDVKYHTPKGMLLVPNHLAQMIFCTNSKHNIAAPIAR